MLGGIFEKNDVKDKIQTFNKKIAESNFWKDKLSAQKILKEKKFNENIFNNFNSVVNELENLEELLKLASKENDALRFHKNLALTPKTILVSCKTSKGTSTFSG